MVYTIDKVLRRYGTCLILQHGTESEIFQGFLQHSGARSWKNMEHVFGPLGEIPGGQYILIAPPRISVAVGDTVLQGEKHYELRRAETVMYGNEPLYVWGLCMEKGGEDTWAMQS